MNAKQCIDGHGNVQVAGDLIVNVYVIRIPAAARRRAAGGGGRHSRLGQDRVKGF